MTVHAQVNDGPAYMPEDKQMDEARGERLLPGEGELDLIGFVRALPPDVPIGLEAGSRSQFARGMTMEECGRAAIAATHYLPALAFVWHIIEITQKIGRLGNRATIACRVIHRRPQANRIRGSDRFSTLAVLSRTPSPDCPGTTSL
jgi:hypothetical protein